MISEADFNKINERSKVNMGDIIMPMIGTVGKPVIVNVEPNFAIKNVSLIKFKDDSRVLNTFVRSLLQSDYFDDAVLSKVRGGTQKFISLGDIRKLAVIVPPMELQEQFAAFVEQTDKSRFIELFGDPETNPKGWTRQRLDQICENLDSRRVPITSTNRKAGNYPYYGASGIVDYVKDYIFDEDILLISEDGANLVMRSTPIAFSVSGKVWVNNHAHVVRFESKATQKYIEICFALTDISGSITGTAQPKLNQAKLNAMMFCVPPIELQEQFATFVKQTDKSKLCGTMEVAA